MKLIWIIIPLLLFVIINVENSFSEVLPKNEECINMNNTKNIVCDENFRTQSMKVFSVVDSSVGIFEDPITKLTIVDLGSFYGIGQLISEDALGRAGAIELCPMIASGKQHA